MDRKFISPVIPAPNPVTFAQATAHHLVSMAREAIANGMGMTCLFTFT